jgi:regulator of sigma E protease
MIDYKMIVTGVGVLGLLVFIHELGHFLAAKYFRVRVEVFSLGFGPRLFGFRRGDTDYRLSPIPLGGYVRMVGEFPGDTPDGAADPGALTSKPRWQRMIILLAGPAMNIALAIVLWWALFVYGMEALDIPDGPPVVEKVEAGSPAERAGLQPGDALLALDGESIRSAEEYQMKLIFKPGKSVVYRIQRGAESFDRTVEVAKDTRHGVGRDGIRIRTPILVSQIVPGGAAERDGLKPGDRILSIDGRLVSGPSTAVEAVVQSGGKPIAFELLRGDSVLEVTITPAVVEEGKPRIGAGFSYPIKLIKLDPIAALGESFETAAQNTSILFKTIGLLLRRELGLEVMSGPLEIARISSQEADRGLGPLLQLLAFISFQLGLFNLLPIPVLDGGHMAILTFEGALRRDLSPRFKERVLQFGFVLLVVFAAVVIFLDARKLRDLGARETQPSAPPPTQTEAPAKP